MFFAAVVRAALFRAVAVAAVLVVGGTAVAQTLEVQSGATFFTADPEPGFYVDRWTGPCGNNVGEVADPVTESGAAKKCRILPEAAGTVGVVILPVPNRAVEFLPTADGTLFATVAGVRIESGGSVVVTAAITVVAEPDANFYVSDWSGENSACAGRGELGDQLQGGREECVVPPGRADVTVGATFAGVLTTVSFVASPAYQTTMDLPQSIHDYFGESFLDRQRVEGAKVGRVRDDDTVRSYINSHYLPAMLKKFQGLPDSDAYAMPPNPHRNIFLITEGYGDSISAMQAEDAFNEIYNDACPAPATTSCPAMTLGCPDDHPLLGVGGTECWSACPRGSSSDGDPNRPQCRVPK